MKFSGAFKLIVKIEEAVNTEEFIWKGFHTWPILRKVLWLKLISTSQNEKIIKKNYTTILYVFIKNVASSIYYSFKKIKAREDSNIIFFSRPQYLQKIHSERFIDRIVDPIIESFNTNNKISKYYFLNIPKDKVLIHDSFHLHQNTPFIIIKLSIKQKEMINKIAKLLDINNLELQQSYRHELQTFIGYYNSAKKLLIKHKKLKEIYTACWYFPDMMGVCAAASEFGIKTIDIQHGKQGRYQAMYSGWTKIPENGYDLMPDSFWCWGQPSCDHILATSPNRKKHIPFIGGYPWIDYYKKNILHLVDKISNNKLRVLVTLQPPMVSNLDRIPDFIIDFLSSSNADNINFIFRLHPNEDDDGYHLCKKRLKSINPGLYSIDIGTHNLYDVFRKVTHHITAYGSCCYEASLFNIPTLLYGNESKEIYEDEIQNKVFAWTDSNKDDLVDWLYDNHYQDLKKSHQYIMNAYK